MKHYSHLVKKGATLLGLALASISFAIDYEVRPLHMGNAIAAEAYGINDKGEIVGSFQLVAGGKSFPCMWRNGLLYILPTPASSMQNRAVRINNNSQAVGWTQISSGGSSYYRGAYWELGDPLVTMNTVTGTVTDNSFASAINDAGQVVGYGDGIVSVNILMNGDQGVRWTKSGGANPLNIGLIFQDQNAYTRLTAVNSFGTACGYGQDESGNDHVIRHKNTLQDMGVPVGMTKALATGINDAADMSVTAKSGSNPHRAYRWTTLGGFSMLPVYSGLSTYSHITTDINESGHVIGHATGSGNFFPLIWRDGGVIKINDMLINTNGWKISEVNDLSDRGEMVGFATNATTGQSAPAIVSPVQYVNITVGLSDWMAGATGVPCQVRFEDLATGNLIDQRNVTLVGAGSVGTATVPTFAQGNVKVIVKPWHWLSKSFTRNLAAHATVTASGTYANGDIDGDDEVSVLDYIILSATFGTEAGQLGFDVDADLDGDSVVSILDYLILSKNYGTSGA
jgi:hypothetical protein